MGKKIITHDESDEDLILGSLMKGNRPELEGKTTVEKPIVKSEEEIIEVAPLKEEPKRRKSKNIDFPSIFLKENRSSSRGGKNINIRQEFHNKIKRILGVIAENDLSFYGYIDNVLEHHFNTYKEELDELFKKNNQL